VYLTGPPGAGKSMLAERLPGLLPDLELAEALEVSAIHSVAELLPEAEPLLRRPPFIDPHHTDRSSGVQGYGRNRSIERSSRPMSGRSCHPRSMDPSPDTPDAGEDPGGGGRVSLSVLLAGTPLDEPGAVEADTHLGMLTQPDELLLVVLGSRNTSTAATVPTTTPRRGPFIRHRPWTAQLAARP